jgi:hypothetical protein
VLVGKMTNDWMEPVTAYWGYMTVSRVSLLLVSYLFVSTFLDRISQRRLAFLLIFFSSGLGGLFLSLGAVVQSQGLYQAFNADLRFKELNTFLTLYCHPHFALSLALILLLARSWFRHLIRSRKRDLLAALACLLLIGLFNPYSLVAADAALVASCAGMTLAQRRLVPSTALALLAALLVTAPLLVYNFFTFVRDPFWGRIYSAQSAHTHVTPGPLPLIAGYGLVLVLAILGSNVRPASHSSRSRFAVLWAGACFVVAYLPFSFQSRALFGVHPFLCLLAVHGMEHLSRLGRHTCQERLHRLVRIGVRSLVVFLFTGSVVGVYFTVLAFSFDFGNLGKAVGVYEKAPLAKVAERLTESAALDDLVMAAYRSGNFLVAHSPVRAFYGHFNATLEPEEKRNQVEVFYSSSTPDSWRKNLIDQYGITFVLYGPYEAEIGDFDPGQVDCMQLDRQVEDVALYKVGHVSQ